MIRKNFRLNVIARLLIIGLLLFVALWGYLNTSWQVTPVVCALLAVLLVGELIRYVESVSRELASFLQFVAHRDFAVSLPLQGKGKTFARLQTAYQQLTNIYRNLNLEKAANHQYLEAVVEHVSVALVCMDEQGTVKLMNRQAKKLLRAPYLYNLESFQRIDPSLPQQLHNLSNGERALINLKVGDESLQVALYATEFQLLGTRHKIISFQDIRNELEQREVDFSQKLIKVLTHEIMNSVTPIISLSAVIEDTLLGTESEAGEEQDGAIIRPLSEQDRQDLLRSLNSIQSRGTGLLRFVQAYSTLTNLPRPQFAQVQVKKLFDQVQSMMAAALEQADINLEQQLTRADLTLRADPQQLEQVLINLIKNALEALAGKASGRIILRAETDEQGKALIKVIDNGPGISPAYLDNIFVPFFTTKRHGSGVGLSVSRQIMFLNKGLLAVKSTSGVGAEFTLKFR